MQCCGSGIRCLFDPWDPGSGMGKNKDPDPESCFRELRNHFFGLKKILKFFDADPGSRIFLILDPGSEME
jgi:hypothetical protein